jgi:PAS domain S-box-containing protein
LTFVDTNDELPERVAVLLIEDSESDATPVACELRRAVPAIDIVRVRETALIPELSRRNWDLVISDWSSPRFGGRAALELVKAALPDVPFIIVSGAVVEATALAAMRAGAQDYVLRDNLSRLAPAVERELREAKIREACRETEAALRKSKDGLRESEERFRQMTDSIESIGEVFWLSDPAKTDMVYVSPAYEELWGRSRASVLADPMSWLESVDPEDRERVRKALPNQARGTYDEIYRIRRPDGTVRWIRDRAFVVPQRSAGSERIAGIAEDVTLLKQAEEVIRAKERRFRSLIENSLDVIAVIDAEGVIRFQSPSTEKVLGYRPEELVGGSVFDLIHPADRPRALALFQEGLPVPRFTTSFETRVQHKDGSWRYLEARGCNLLDDPDVRGIILNARDVTDRRAAEDQLRLLHCIVLAASGTASLEEALEVVLRLICEANGIILATAWVPDRRGVLQGRAYWAANPEARGRYREFVEGFSFEKGRGLPGRVWSSGKPAFIPSLADDPDFARKSVAARIGLRSGLAVPVQVDEEVVSVIETFFTHESSLDEGLVRLLRAVGAQIGAVVQRRRAEEALRDSEAQLQQAQKMDAMGRLTAGVAHDFNNLLSVIVGYSALIGDGLPADDPRRADLMEIKEAGERAAELTRQLLAFSRRQVLQPRVVDLNQIVSRLESLLRRLIGEDIELEVVPSPAAAPVSVDAGQMEQVIMNLVINARDAMPTGGRLIIRIELAQVDEAFTSEHPGAAPGPHVMLVVADTGVGMDAATRARIFEPFFTTKEPGQGTGLGLSTVFGIVRQSAGMIRVSSEVGKGTTFRIYLPAVEGLVEKPIAPNVEPTVEVDALRGSETILVVEDEDCVRHLACSILERQGYRVLEARTGIEALEIERREPVIDLLLTDVVMPGMSGAEVAARLRIRRQGLKVLYMSGYTDNAMVLHGVRHSEVAFLQKPITPLELLTKVKEVIGDSQDSVPHGAQP